VHGFLFAFRSNYGRIISDFGDIHCQKNGMTLKTALEVIQGH